jgi:hypothetical protein
MLQTFSDSPIQSIEKYLDHRLIVGRIENVDEELGTIEVSYISQEGFKSFNIPHPHFGADSWIRAMPELGSYVLIGTSQYNQFPEIIKLFDPSERVRIALNHILEIKPDADPNNPKEMMPVDRISRASAGRPDGRPFRKLRQGEMEIMGRGKSSIWLSRRGQLLEKASVARRLIDSDRSMIQDWAVGHEKLGIDAYLKNCLWDSEYFGVVRRPPDDPTDLPLGTLLNVAAIVQEINGSIAIQDRVTSQVSNFKSQLATLKQDYEKQLTELKEKSKDWLKTLKSTTDAKTYPDTCNTSISYISNLISTLDKLTAVAGQLKTLGTSVNYVNVPYDIALNQLDQQRKVIQTNGTTIEETTAPVFDSTQQEQVQVQFDTFTKLEVTKIPEYTPEAAIAAAFDKYKLAAAGMDAQIQEAINEAKIIVPGDVHVIKKYVWTEPKLKDTGKGTKEFAKEWRMTLSWKGYPRKIYEHSIGHVYDSEGKEETTPVTGKKTRSRHTWWCDPPNEVKTGAEWLDTDGNLIKFLAECASKGFVFVIPDGHHYLDVGRTAELRTGDDAIAKIAGNLKIVVAKDVIVDAENFIFKARDKFQVDATQIILNQETNSANKVTRPIQRTVDTKYLDSPLIQQITVTTAKVQISEQVKRRIVEGNVLLTDRQKQIEDVFTNVGAKQSSINLISGNIMSRAEQNITSKADQNIIEDSKINITKAEQNIVEQAQQNIVESAGQAITNQSSNGTIGSGYPTAGKVAW